MRGGGCSVRGWGCRSVQQMCRYDCAWCSMQQMHRCGTCLEGDCRAGDACVSLACSLPMQRPRRPKGWHLSKNLNGVQAASRRPSHSRPALQRQGRPQGLVHAQEPVRPAHRGGAGEDARGEHQGEQAARFAWACARVAAAGQLSGGQAGEAATLQAPLAQQLPSLPSANSATHLSARWLLAGCISQPKECAQQITCSQPTSLTPLPLGRTSLATPLAASWAATRRSECNTARLNATSMLVNWLAGRLPLIPVAAGRRHTLAAARCLHFLSNLLPESHPFIQQHTAFNFLVSLQQ